MSDNTSRRPPGDASADRGSPRRSVSERLDLLANSRRRATLRYLVERRDRLVCLDDIVDHLSEAGHGDRQNVRISLLHLHLPKLARAGVLVYDESKRQVRYVRQPAIERLLAFVAEE